MEQGLDERYAARGRLLAVSADSGATAHESVDFDAVER